MKEFDLIEVYGSGRNAHFLPNTKQLDDYVYKELMKICTKEDFKLWIGIYRQYSKWGILEKYYQLGMSEFSWYDIHLLLCCKQNFKILLKQRDRFLKNKRSKY